VGPRYVPRSDQSETTENGNGTVADELCRGDRPVQFEVVEGLLPSDGTSSVSSFHWTLQPVTICRHYLLLALTAPSRIHNTQREFERNTRAILAARTCGHMPAEREAARGMDSPHRMGGNRGFHLRSTASTAIGLEHSDRIVNQQKTLNRPRYCRATVTVAAQELRVDLAVVFSQLWAALLPSPSDQNW
jgi:hypothetical protein